MIDILKKKLFLSNTVIPTSFKENILLVRLLCLHTSSIFRDKYAPQPAGKIKKEQILKSKHMKKVIRLRTRLGEELKTGTWLFPRQLFIWNKKHTVELLFKYKVWVVFTIETVPQVISHYKWNVCRTCFSRYFCVSQLTTFCADLIAPWHSKG